MFNIVVLGKSFFDTHDPFPVPIGIQLITLPTCDFPVGRDEHEEGGEGCFHRDYKKYNKDANALGSELSKKLLDTQRYVYYNVYMRTNIDLDDELVSKAQKITGIKTKRELVHEGLKVLIQLKGKQSLTELQGKIKFAKGYDYKSNRK